MGSLSGVVKQLNKERARLENELHRVTAALTRSEKFTSPESNRSERCQLPDASE
jgi:hypothetical protein